LSRRLQVLGLAALVVATVGCAAFAGWVDLHNADVQASIVAVAGASFAITVLFGRGGWLGGFLVGFGVPLAHLYANVAHITLPYPFPHPMSSFVALVPALGGMITGLALRAGMRSIRGSGVGRPVPRGRRG
jgi:hypothetical protein